MIKQRLLFPILLCLLLLSSLGAETPGLPENPADLLGLSVCEAVGLLGLPDSLSTARGTEAWQDDVVFSYDSHVSLFWFRDRVWQIRFDREFEGAAWGLKIGFSPAEVAAVLGRKPAGTGENWEVYSLPGRGYPLRVQVYYRENRAEEYYLYRGDF